MPIGLNEWSQAVVYERLREARERRLAAEARGPQRWPGLRRAAAVCGSR